MKQKEQIFKIPVEQLIPGKYQPRRIFTAESLQELAKSIAANGLVQPIVVRPSHPYYEIVAGERRWRAAQLAGLNEVDCLVKSYSDAQAAEVATVENVNREDLNPVEEATAYQRLYEDFNYSHDEIAAVVGKSRAKITNQLRLLKLVESVQQLIIEGELSEGHGKILAGLDPTAQRALANRCVAKKWSVRNLERHIKTDPIENHQHRDINVEYLERSLSEHIGSRVAIACKQQGGQLLIDFYDNEVLAGILQKLGYKET